MRSSFNNVHQKTGKQMKIKINVIAAAAISLAAIGAQAQQNAPTPWYGEVGYAALNVRAGGGKLNPHALRGIVGYGFHPNIAAEAMLAAGVRDDSGLKVKSAAGVFLKPRVQIDDLELFARVGWVQSRVSAFGFSGDDDDLAWGAGLNYSINPRTYVTLDYTQYFSKSGVRVDGATLGVGFRC